MALRRAVAARIRALWRALAHRDELDRDMNEEMRFHLDLQAERLMREQGLDAAEARRRAYVAFGGLEKYKQLGRDTRRLSWIDALTFDCRLGVRMLAKYPGLTLIGGFAIAVAIAIGATFFEAITELLSAKLPFAAGNRIVAVQLATENPGSPERRVLHDFLEWRGSLTSIEQLGAFRTVQHNLVATTTAPEPVKVGEITASGFGVAQTPPLLGRYLLSTDERQGAPPVLVIGFHAWQSRFGGDPQIVGRAVTLGGVQRVVVGVMPEGFKFPVDHQFWIPLQLNPLNDERLQGPALYVFGRLASGVTLRRAQAELTAIGERFAAAQPRSAQAGNSQARQHLRPVVLPYTREHLDLSHPTLVWVLRVAQLLVGALAFVVSVNLAILVYARTVTRLGEIAVRTALGANRRRILAQLFIEAFALSIIGAGAGLGLSHYALRGMQALAVANGSVPFWLDFRLSGVTAVYALALAVFAAVIMGVLPGLKATGKRVSVNLHELNGRAGTRLGAVWTTLVVTQVAVAVAVLPVAAYVAWQVARIELAGAGFPAGEFVVANIARGDDASAVDPLQVRGRQLELMSRLRSEPGVSAVTYSSSIPGFAAGRRVEFEGGTTARQEVTSEVSTLDVSLDMFEVYGADIVAGRGFTTSDLGVANAVVVNRTFATMFLGPRSPLGLRFRYASPASASAAETRGWYQIVGVVRDFPDFPQMMSVDSEPVVYHPVAPGEIDALVVSVRFAGGIPGAFIDRFRQIAAEVDPALQLRRVLPLSDFYDQLRAFWRYLAWGIGLITVSVLSLSAAGIYALMSFTVAQRTREIGIRIALGAHPRRLLASIFARALRQLAFGVLIGSLLSGAMLATTTLTAAQIGGLLSSVGVLLAVVALLAAFGPARRGLRIQATEALRADG